MIQRLCTVCGHPAHAVVNDVPLCARHAVPDALFWQIVAIVAAIAAVSLVASWVTG